MASMMAVSRASGSGARPLLGPRRGVEAVGAVISAVAVCDITWRAGMPMGVVFLAGGVATCTIAARWVVPSLARGVLVVIAPVELWLAGSLWGPSWMWGLAAVGAGLTAGALIPSRVSARRGSVRSGVVVVGVGAVWLAAVVWSGANDPAASWFGALVSHGSRASDMVALTFDDGPNDSATLAVADVLTARGARGSFFLVGAAVEARPELARQLAARGEVVGNHSFRHGRNDWLVPDYPEVRRGQVASSGVLGRCPSFFRPPYGRHSPFTAAAAARLGLRTVTWDVNGHDWDTSDPAVIARRVMARVRPGSIVLLHDGANGVPTADRSVLVPAVSLILDGLATRRLRAVGLDELLGTSAWTSSCPPT